MTTPSPRRTSAKGSAGKKRGRERETKRAEARDEEGDKEREMVWDGITHTEDTPTKGQRDKDTQTKEMQRGKLRYKKHTHTHTHLCGRFLNGLRPRYCHGRFPFAAVSHSSPTIHFCCFKRTQKRLKTPPHNDKERSKGEYPKVNRVPKRRLSTLVSIHCPLIAAVCSWRVR